MSVIPLFTSKRMTERHHFMAGSMKGATTVVVRLGWCECCRRTVAVMNPQAWPGFPGLVTGECHTCHSTIAPYPDPPEAA